MCEKDLLSVLSCIIERVVKKYDKNSTFQKNIFSTLNTPKISIRDYLERMRKYFHCSVECFVLSLIYFDRLIQNADYVANSYNIHRLLLASVVTAAKFFDDSYYVNSYYASVGGVSLEELNELEISFLFTIRFGLHVDCDEYQHYHNEIYNHVASGQCRACNGLSFPALTLVNLSNQPSLLAYVMPDTDKFTDGQSSPCNIVMNATNHVNSFESSPSSNSLPTPVSNGSSKRITFLHPE